MNYQNIKFKGSFRTYQAKVLENVEKHNQDNKIHIVAAPGSGKTILGLELIRYFDQPALIFSPSITIRQQWGSRFESYFIDDSQKLSDIFSFDLKQPNLITCVTYQALHAALNRLLDQPKKRSEEDEIDEENTELDFRTFDLVKTIKQAGIKTICLDEAHHLRSEWQRSLELFIEKIGSEMTILSLTATPPYDSPITEWDRYISVCGEIDDEISTPQLVAQGNLCPHQDYVYFNYPTQLEMSYLSQFKKKVLECINEILSSDLVDRWISETKIMRDDQNLDEILLDYPKGFIAFLSLIKHSGRILPKRLVKLITGRGKLPNFDLKWAEVAFQFIIDQPGLFSEASSEQVRSILAQHGFYVRQRVSLASNEKINRMIISSVGKLDSISKITHNEYHALGSSLRLLILTDHIKRDLLHSISTHDSLLSMGVVPIFETLKREISPNIPMAVVSGSLVIVPNSIIDELKKLAQQNNMACHFKPLADCDYSEVLFNAQNKHKVKLMTQAFELGLIKVLIGTSALLGEGWDSPCINSIILASFVGSFMLSNQMRGRAIRIDPHHADKTANIWHLVTIEPGALLSTHPIEKLSAVFHNLENQAEGADYELCVRRFKTFYAPSYDGSSIENGIQRLSLIQAPFTQANIEHINEAMIKRANDRSAMAHQWLALLKGNPNPEIIDINEFPKQVIPTSFIFVNVVYAVLIAGALEILIQGILRAFLFSNRLPWLILYILLSFIMMIFLGKTILKIIRFMSPIRTIKILGQSILEALIDLGEIRSKHAHFVIQSDQGDITIKGALVDATTYEKNIFAQAMRELLSAIDNPRYLLIKAHYFLFFTWKDYRQSYACPTIFSNKKESVELFEHRLSQKSGHFIMLFTRSEKGRVQLLKCRKASLINLNEVFIKGKKIIKTRWE